jgi:hypothetical protein
MVFEAILQSLKSLRSMLTFQDKGYELIYGLYLAFHLYQSEGRIFF